MSVKRKNGSQKNEAELARPFAPAILKRARQIVEHYQVVLGYDDGEYYGRGLELPGAMDDGKTADECVAKTREAMVSLFAYMLEEGTTPPPPASKGRRTEQVNVQLTAAEKVAMEKAAHRHGYRAISEYV